MTKARLPREWLWFIGSWLVAFGYAALATASDDSEYGGDYGGAAIEATLWGVGLYALCGLVRLTWWAVQTVIKSK